MVKVATEIFELAKKANTLAEREAYMTCLAIVEKKVLEDEQNKWIEATQTSNKVLAMYDKRRNI